MSGKQPFFRWEGDTLVVNILGKPSAKLDDRGRALYQTLDLPATPFKDVRFCAPPRKDSKEVKAHVDQRSQGVTPYVWGIRELCRDQLFPYLFIGHDLDAGNLQYLVSTVSAQLAKLAKESDDADEERRRARRESLYVEPFGDRGNTEVRTFDELIAFLQDKVDAQDQRWISRNATGTGEAMLRRLWGIRNDVAHVIRGDLTPEEMNRYRLDPLAEGASITVCDLNKLGSKAQTFIVGVLLRKLFLEKEKRGKDPIVFVLLDELNKYAPREGRSPIKDQLVEIAERGRSLGIILIGAQQTASQVERRVVGQSAIRVVGRLDPAEAENAEYHFLPPAARKRALFLKSGTVFVQQPQVPSPILVSFPYPAYATKGQDAGTTAADDARFDLTLGRFGL